MGTLAGGGGGADRAAAGLSRSLPAPHPRARADLVVPLHLLVDDGPLRAGFARPWRIHGHRRLCHRAVVELSPYQPVDRHSAGDADGSRRGGADRLALLPLPHHRALFRAADTGSERDRAAGHHRDARYHRRLAPAIRRSATTAGGPAFPRQFLATGTRFLFT